MSSLQTLRDAIKNISGVSNNVGNPRNQDDESNNHNLTYWTSGISLDRNSSTNNVTTYGNARNILILIDMSFKTVRSNVNDNQCLASKILNDKFSQRSYPKQKLIQKKNKI